MRSRKFPAIVNCTSIDWFHEWPEEALRSVSYRFLLQAESELLTVNCTTIFMSSKFIFYCIFQPELCQSISKFMSYVHGSVNDMSKIYLANERRYNYTTPKSFLELVRDNIMHSSYSYLLLISLHTDCSVHQSAL